MDDVNGKFKEVFERVRALESQLAAHVSSCTEGGRNVRNDLKEIKEDAKSVKTDVGSIKLDITKLNGTISGVKDTSRAWWSLIMGLVTLASVSLVLVQTLRGG